MSLPPHVIAIEPDHVRLGGNLAQLLPRLREQLGGERVFRDPQLRVCVSFPPGEANPFLNPHLIELLDSLAAEGAAFLEAYDQAYGPAEFMRALQAGGEIERGFNSLIIRSAEDWNLTPHGV